eukprot:g6458.t1 g6458   contig23:506490-509749(-)
MVKTRRRHKLDVLDKIDVISLVDTDESGSEASAPSPKQIHDVGDIEDMKRLALMDDGGVEPMSNRGDGPTALHQKKHATANKSTGSRDAISGKTAERPPPVNSSYCVQPDGVVSSINAQSCVPLFDENDYRDLHQRYLTPRVREKAQLPGGMTLRRQCRSRIIDQKTPGYRKLRHRVDALLKKNNHPDVYRLLCQLRDFELDPRKVPEIFREEKTGNDDNDDDDGFLEYVDLTNDNEDRFIDVDECITDLLLVNVKSKSGQTNSKRPDRIGSGESNTVEHMKNQLQGVYRVENCGVIAIEKFLDALIMNVAKESVTSDATGVPDVAGSGEVIVQRKMEPSASEAMEAGFDTLLLALLNKEVPPLSKAKDSKGANRGKRQSFTSSSLATLAKTLLSKVGTPDGSSSKTARSQTEDGTSERRTSRRLWIATKTDALKYLDKVKERFVSCPAIFIKFSELILSFQQGRDIGEVADDVSALLAGHDDLREEFSHWLPAGVQVAKKVVSNKSMPKRVMRELKVDPSSSSSVAAAKQPRPRFSGLDFGFSSIQSDILCLQNACGGIVVGNWNRLQQTRGASSSEGYTYTSVFASYQIPMQTLQSVQRNSISFQPTIAQQLPKAKGSNIEVQNVCVIPSRRTVLPPRKPSQISLADEWRQQNRKRRKKEWTPNGHLTGRWKAPKWANGISDNSPVKYATCRRSLLPQLESLVDEFVSLATKTDAVAQVSTRKVLCNEVIRANQQKKSPVSLREIVCPLYVTPDLITLFNAHQALGRLLPKSDLESFDVLNIARRYYDHWRPPQTRVILLAESHAFTETERALKGPGLDRSLLERYTGPREHLRLVYSLTYGEKEALSCPDDDANKGTPQFWTLFAACSRGVEFVPDIDDTKQNGRFTSKFALDLLKGGRLSVEDRLEAKLRVLEDMKRRGIWLLDASIFGWYISQPQQYARSSVSNEIHRVAKQRPPKDLKSPSLVLSWELFTKHLIRDVANDGYLKLLIPIGKEVDQSITRERIEDAVKSPFVDSKSHARVEDTFPAPNAWIPGGYGPFYEKLAALVNEAAPVVKSEPE